ncbi:MAG: flagellar motor switch protein FliM [Bacteriovoracaceae bacterium]|jgi:flagellar motor switch protein FliM|nr:flagellar motor switch protein FliM [Bacteriovoracaceae bacterium]HPX49747.1 flagellar motor switch protein FliM [Deltaproteobacteria bacterium]HRR20778.1 flagellar motor switch protein FliM [Desulfomonilia bacterium]HQA71078.1 flagellar motor switch protein FliM [Deltaproteobacteria bacterium]HRR68411.1 flagellar motor switch protein FliM [Desulfomonilia bacterium]
MGQILSQEEVDALLKGVVGGEIETETDTLASRDQADYQRFDFAAHDKVIRGRMPTLDAINDRFARFFRNTVSGLLRKMVDVTPVSLDTLKFGNFMRSLPVPSSIHIIRVEPLRGNALVVLETKLVFALIDCFFGGRGAGAMKVEGREFTPIEQHMLFKVVSAAIKDLELSWQPVYELSLEYVRGEMNPQFAGIIPNDDVLIVVQFDIEMEEMSGNIMIGIPYMLIEPIRDRLYASFHTEEKTNVDSAWVNRFKHELMGVFVDVSVELGKTTITSRELASLKEGDILVLEKDVSDELIVMVQNLPKYYARPGKLKDNLAVDIVSLADRQLY